MDANTSSSRCPRLGAAAAALLLALFSFVGSMAMAKFLLRGEVIE